MSVLDPAKNFAKVAVAVGFDSSATSVSLAPGDGAKLPDPSVDGPFNLVVWNSTDYPDPTDDPSKEIIRVTSRTIDTLDTVTRGQEGTSAANHNTGGKTYLMILAPTKKLVDDISAFMNRFRWGTAVISPSGTTVLYDTPFPAGGIYVVGIVDSPAVSDPSLTVAVKKTIVDENGFTAEAYPENAQVSYFAINIA